MAGIFALCARLRTLPSCRRGFRNIFSLQPCKGGLGLACPSATLAVQYSAGQRTPSICTLPTRWLGSLAHTQGLKSTPDGLEQFRLIYRFPGIRYCTVLSRLKLLQTALTVLILPPVWVLYWQNHVPQSLCLYCTGIACFAAAMLYGMSFYLRRIIGMMYLNEDGTLLRVAHLNFWGKRKDFCCPVETVMTLADIGENSNEMLLRFQQYNGERFLYFSLRFGKIVDQEGFAKVFGEPE